MKDSFDIVVLGTGIGGLSFALKVAGFAKVALVTKKHRAESNTNYAQGGIAAVTSLEDTFDLHVRDTLRAGDGLCDPKVVRAIVSQAPDRIRDLTEIGVTFDERLDGNGQGPDLGKEGGHSKRRVLHVGDMTGRAIESGLLRAVEKHPNLLIFENHYAIDLITTSKLGQSGPNRCVGVYVLNAKDRQVMVFSARAVVLATGGCGKAYLYTTNPDIATGDGVAMAYRAGVPILNMEFIQFHPTCLYHPFNKNFLISEALRGEGARLVNRQGQDFMVGDPEVTHLSTRDKVARAIDAEMKRSGEPCVFLDITHHSEEFLRKRFPTIFERCASLGIRMDREPIPVVPAAHYQCGGVEAALDGTTALEGLFAIGEVACTGLHGANRLASNSLLEAVVLAHNAALRVRECLPYWHHVPDLPPWHEGDAEDLDERVVLTHNWRELRQLMWDYVGIVRTNKRLQRARNRLEILQSEIQEFYWDFKVTPDLLELRNLTLVSSLIVESAMRRRESRGLHYNLDYPETLKHGAPTRLQKKVS